MRNHYTSSGLQVEDVKFHEIVMEHKLGARDAVYCKKKSTNRTSRSFQISPAVFLNIDRFLFEGKALLCWFQMLCTTKSTFFRLIKTFNGFRRHFLHPNLRKPLSGHKGTSRHHHNITSPLVSFSTATGNITGLLREILLPSHLFGYLVVFVY